MDIKIKKNEIETQLKKLKEQTEQLTSAYNRINQEMIGLQYQYKLLQEMESEKKNGKNK